MPPCALGSSRFRAVTAIGWLLGLLVRGVLVAPPAVLAELDPVGIVLLVLQGGVVAPFADATGQGDDVFHGCLFGGEKEKSLGFLGAVNSSRGSRGPGPNCSVPCVPGHMIRSMLGQTIAVLHGDQTCVEVLREAHRLLDPGVLGLPLETRDFDLSLDERRRTRNQCVLDAASALRELGFGIKAATITPEGSGDVGSPNAILRKQVDGRVIVRTGRRIPGIRPLAGVHAPISVIRMAVDDAYGAREWREGHDLDEWAFRTEKISRRTCRIVAEYAFTHARRFGAKVFGGPKFTVSPVYEGMFKEELDAAAKRHADVSYEPQLIDATYAMLLTTSGEALVIPALNRDGDTLSDLVMQMFGTIAGAESTLLAFDDSGAVTVAMTEAPHGTAPALEGKNVANPMAMIMAVASLLGYMQGEDARRASRAIYEAALEAVSDGVRTADLGGHTSTGDFSNEVVRRVKTKVDVWSALADIER